MKGRINTIINATCSERSHPQRSTGMQHWWQKVAHELRRGEQSHAEVHMSNAGARACLVFLAVLVWPIEVDGDARGDDATESTCSLGHRFVFECCRHQEIERAKQVNIVLE